jgi:hypothetical protein
MRTFRVTETKNRTTITTNLLHEQTTPSTVHLQRNLQLQLIKRQKPTHSSQLKQTNQEKNQKQIQHKVWEKQIALKKNAGLLKPQ